MSLRGWNWGVADFIGECTVQLEEKRCMYSSPWGITFHMGQSDSVTCDPAQVYMPHLNPRQMLNVYVKCCDNRTRIF